MEIFPEFRNQEAFRELEAFAYSVSHDLRAPLRHIDGFLELLKRRAGTLLDEQSRSYLDTVSDRPDFWIGVYGAYGNIVGQENGHGGRKFKARENITPAFLVQAGNDSKVSPLNSTGMYKYLYEKGVPAELHIYEQGEHGFALERNRGPAVTSTVDSWSERLLEWLKLRGIL